MIDQMFTLLSMLAAVGFVVILAYFTTVIIGKKSNSLIKNSSIKVLERSSIGMQMNITIVQISGKVYILANQGKQLVVLDTIDGKEWQQDRLKVIEGIGEQHPMPMESIFSKVKEKVGINSIFKKGDEEHKNED